MTALLRYQTAILLRSHRWIFPLIAYVLLFLFNPIVTSLRGIQQASELKKVQKKLGCPRVSLGSLSEATQVFDPEPLRQIAAELGLGTSDVRLMTEQLRNGLVAKASEVSLSGDVEVDEV